MNNLLFLAVGMSMVTMVPRIIPMFWLKSDRISPALKNFFKYLPAAMLTALILPGVAFSSGTMALSLAGALTAVVISLAGVGPTGTVMGSVAALYLLQVFNLLN